MKILVTGGSGFIGSHVVEHYQAGPVEIRVVDNLRTGYRNNLNGLRHDFIEGSITDPVCVREAMAGVDYVFHLAAMVSVPESMEKPRECNQINVDGTLILLEEAERAGVKKLVMASSAAIYGENATVPKVESMLPEPRSPYAITKLDGEYYCEVFRREGRLNTATLRFFNVFGPRQDPKGAYAAAVPIFIERALKGESITIHGDGGQTRDFIYVKDIIGALTLAAEQENVQGVFNAGYGGKITIKGLAEAIVELAGASSSIRYGPSRPGDVRHSRASTDKLRALGWQPQYTWQNALEQTLQHFIKNPTINPE